MKNIADKMILYRVKGVVIQGKNRGKKLGIPTINMKTTLDIPHGVYISQAIISKKTCNSVSFIGEAKTFDEKEVYLETLVLDFDEDIYGISVEVILLKKIRENQKFATPADLVSQIEKDKKLAREFFDANQS